MNRGKVEFMFAAALKGKVREVSVGSMALVIAVCLFTPVPAFSQAAKAEDLKPTTAPDIPGVVAGGTKVTVIKGGFPTVEGPTAIPDGTLIFTDRESNRLWKVGADDSVTTYLVTENGTSSVSMNSKGVIFGAQRTPPQIGTVAPTKGNFADKYDGKPFPGPPNEVMADKKGGVYFTAGQLFYAKPNHEVIRISDSIARPNGIQLSRDERILYVADTAGESLYAFDVQPDGSATNQRKFGKLEGMRQTERGPSSGADGIAIDSQGRLYVASNAGVEVLSPTGDHLGTIPVPMRVQNLAFAGKNKKTLYIVGNGTVCKVQMKAQGFKGRNK
ncbi:MAG TPA: SMP-30/gluconolactonase/LRE family protein [Terriglobales bacterium]|jgi:gluconolactonase|nr:SMP-30/gluconolactonase/LRE family protein [Terriglobales bacterium]